MEAVLLLSVLAMFLSPSLSVEHVFFAPPDADCCTPPDVDLIYENWQIVKAIPVAGKFALLQATMVAIANEHPEIAAKMSEMVGVAANPLQVYTDIDVNLSLLHNRPALWEQVKHYRRKSAFWRKIPAEDIKHVMYANARVFDSVLSVFHWESWQRCLSVIVSYVETAALHMEVYARCDVAPETGDPSQPIKGYVTFRQKMTGGKTYVRVKLGGFDTSDPNRYHGFHIHEKGSLANQCKDSGGHYNPRRKEHGSPYAKERHVGDLGNIVHDSKGWVKTSIADDHLSLEGRFSIIGRALVIHAGSDDMGLGGFPDSKTTGHAGARLACCVIREVDSL